MLIAFSLAPNIEGTLFLLQYGHLCVWFIEEARAGDYAYKGGDLIRLRNTYQEELKWIVRQSVDCPGIVVC